MKILSIAIPCYNSAAYMRRCIDSLLSGGEDVEILIVDDGSTKDNTAEIADEYEKNYPGIVKAIHQENGGHGEAVNAGLRNATGVYYKVVDSDDWVDVDVYLDIIKTLKELVAGQQTVDMFISNFVYDKAGAKHKKVMRYKAFPENEVFQWDHAKKLHIGRYILMHSVIYRTMLLRECNLELPKHTFYVDNLFVFQPLPYVKNLYYKNVNFYHYFIGRDDQSVNEKVLMKRIDQQIKVTKLVSDCVNLGEVSKTYPKLAAYMTRNISIMMAISSIHLLLIGDKEAYAKRENLWEHIKALHPKLYSILKYRRLSGFTYLPGGTAGGFVTLTGYRLARKMYQFQ